MRKRWIAAIIAGGVGVWLLSTRRRQFNPDELHNLFWDSVARRWRTEAEVAAIIAQNPRMAPEPITSGEASVLSYMTEIEASAERYSLDPALIAAIISKESSGDYAARGPVAEYGLMQIRFTTAQMLGFRGDADLLLNPSVNVNLGSQYLDWQRRRYLDKPDPVTWAVAGYNAGTAQVQGGEFTNQGYVDDVIKYRMPRFRLLIDRAHGIYR